MGTCYLLFMSMNPTRLRCNSEIGLKPALCSKQGVLFFDRSSFKVFFLSFLVNGLAQRQEPRVKQVVKESPVGGT